MHPMLSLHIDPLASVHATGAPASFTQHLPFATGAPAPFAKDLMFTRPAWQVQLSSEPKQMASVDMLVLPETSAVQPKTLASTPAEVKVTFSSAEDLAEALFPQNTKTDVQTNMHTHEALLDHRDSLRTLHASKDKMHNALLEHRDHILQVRSEMNEVDAGLVDHRENLRTLHAHKGKVHDALLEHKDHILKVRSQMSDVDAGLLNHKTRLQSLCTKATETDSKVARVSAEVKALQKQVSSLTSSGMAGSDVQREVKALQKQVSSLKSAGTAGLETQKEIDALRKRVEKLNRDAEGFDVGLRAHTQMLDEHSGTIKSHSRVNEALEREMKSTSSNVSKLSRSLENKQSTGVEQRVRDLQQSLLETQTQLMALKPRNVAMDLQRKVDIVLGAPRRK